MTWEEEGLLLLFRNSELKFLRTYDFFCEVSLLIHIHGIHRYWTEIYPTLRPGSKFFW